MKLTKLHLFLIIIAVLVASTLGFSVKEYFENKEVHSNEALDKETNYDPFGNNQSYDDSENNYDSTIADLEDIVIPGRRERRHHHDSNGNHIPKHKHSKKHHDDNNNSNNSNNSNNMVDPTQTNNSLANNSRCAPGDIDMSKYILKSEVVPPVCPKCPDSKACPRQKPCAPCPPCARCPEPAFECKKVPNYNAISASNVNNVLPMPRLNSFAQFN